MTERLRRWLENETNEFTKILLQYNIDVTTLRATNNSSVRSVQDKTCKYKIALTAHLNKHLEDQGKTSRNFSQEKIRSSTRLLTNALITLADTQSVIVDKIRRHELLLEEMQRDVDNLRVETLRELTRLRANCRSATWKAPAQPLRVGTYLETSTE